ncbi:hypothetical protein ABL78_1903 [Leptomonas seymouri]|uniref:Alpha-type protein kinase domain-containing protein n=1 Tax=Leptomonas seymouri TaxID=5684 RepID=A0A0N0P7P2_LEPSE|nr:hypothetical protein ABL78_1903 [Leptomonas seymouri]|eukprot:KPI89019.1 hypothetical protein ABL78_1903 [Leptomonas seymouri]
MKTRAVIQKASPEEVKKLVVAKRGKRTTVNPASVTSDQQPNGNGRRRVNSARPPAARGKSPAISRKVESQSACASPTTVPTGIVTKEQARRAPLSPQLNQSTPLSFTEWYRPMPDMVTESGERPTETASSAFDYRTDTQSAEVLNVADIESTLSSLTVEEGDLQATQAVVKKARPQAAESEAQPQTVGPLPQLQPPQVQPQKSDQIEEKAAGNEVVVKEKEDAKEAPKEKGVSGLDSSCSEKVCSHTFKGVYSTPSSRQGHADASPTETTAKPMPPKQTNATRFAMEYRVGDTPPVLVKGCKYVFDNRDMRWRTHNVTVRILHPNRGVSQDNYFAIFAAELLDPTKAAAPMFAKVYRHNIADVSEVDYFSLGQAQALGEEFARDYTRQQPRQGYTKYHLPLLTNRVVVRLDLKSILDSEVCQARTGFFCYRTQDTSAMMFFMEPNTVACAAVGASFASPEVDGGSCYLQGDPDWPLQVYSDIADGFSHFSLVQSRGKMVMHGFLRGNGYLLDPLFHTTDRESFRMGDGGKKAIDSWIARHRCGDTCRALGISRFCEDTVDVSATAVFNPLVNTDNHYTYYLHCLRQMRVVVRIALDTTSAPDVGTDDECYGASQTSESLSPAKVTVRAAPIAPVSTSVTLNAIKYVFHPSRSKWEEVPMVMTVLTPGKPERADERHAYFAIEEIQAGQGPIPMRAKFILRPGTMDAHYYHVGDAYCVCVSLGQVFRTYRDQGVFERNLEFRSAYAVRVPKSEIPESIRLQADGCSFFTHTTADSGDVMFILEPKFKSDAVRLAVGAGGMPRDSEGFDDCELRQIVDAFSHFTLHKSGNHLLVCHLKCKDGLLTRPRINTSNGRGFETINDGQRGILHWAKHHTCNPLCQLLGMSPLPPRLKLYNISDSRLMKYINVVQQHALREDEKVDFNLPSRQASDIASASTSVLCNTCATSTTSFQQLAAAAGDGAKNPSNASGEQAKSSKRRSSSVPPAKRDDELLLRPWVHTGKGAIPHPHTKRNGVIASGPRRPLTQADLNRLQSRGIDTTYVLPATKYECDIGTLSWTVHRTFVRIVAPERGIGQGGMRVCFEVMEIDLETCEETTMVAKMYRRTIKDVVEKDYFTVVMVQKLSSLFAKRFNAEEKSGCDVLLSVQETAVIAIERADLNPELLAKKTGFFSYRTTDSQRLMFTVEPRLVGVFTKYSGNTGEAYPTNESRLSPAAARERTKVFEAVEALSHYSLLRSEGGLLVCDMQGVKSDLTDLEVHSYDGEGLGIGNFGARGIGKFVERHRCTSVCRALQLENLRGHQFEVNDEVKNNNKYVRITERMREIDKMP